MNEDYKPKTTNDQGVLSFMLIWVAAIIGGIVVGSVLTHSAWKEWAIKKGYAFHHPRTGNMVYEPVSQYQLYEDMYPEQAK